MRAVATSTSPAVSPPGHCEQPGKSQQLRAPGVRAVAPQPGVDVVIGDDGEHAEEQRAHRQERPADEPAYLPAACHLLTTSHAARCTAPHGVAATPYPIGGSSAFSPMNTARHAPSAMWLSENRAPDARRP